MPKILFLVLLTVLLPACAVFPKKAQSAPVAVVIPEVPEVQSALQRGDPAAASLAYERAIVGARPAVAVEYRLRAAERAVLAADADRALRLGSAMPPESLDLEQLARLQVLRAESLLLKGQPYAAVEALPASSANQPRLAGRIEELRARALFASDEPPPAPPEPAPQAEPPIAAPGPNAGGMALLLPLSGAYASTGESVRDGFLAAHFQQGAQGRLRLYDVDEGNDKVIAAYRQAVADGAAVIVGPLRKESVAAIAALGVPEVPVLALNYLDEATPLPPRLYQYGLAPEEEARTAAEHAAAQGLRRALALVPETDWGERAYAAFSARLQALGGQVLEVQRYSPKQREFSAVVRGLLRASAVAAPERKPAPGVADSRRRQDADFMFVVARPLEGRLIMPMLNFYYAADLPVYATALVYDGRPVLDLRGLRFCDMPWMLSELSFAAERADAANLAGQKRSPRLFALGYDAYALARGLALGGGAPQRLPGLTGTLSVSDTGAVRRGLQCAQIQAGALQMLDPVAASP